jgi:hypothetical protein
MECSGQSELTGLIANEWMDEKRTIARVIIDRVTFP